MHKRASQTNHFVQSLLETGNDPITLVDYRAPKDVVVNFIHNLNSMNNIASGISHVQDYDDVPQIEAEWKQHRSEMKRAQRAHDDGTPSKKSKVADGNAGADTERFQANYGTEYFNFLQERLTGRFPSFKQWDSCKIVRHWLGSSGTYHLYKDMMDSSCACFEGSINKGNFFAIHEQITKIIGAYPEFEQAFVEDHAFRSTSRPMIQASVCARGFLK